LSNNNESVTVLFSKKISRINKALVDLDKVLASELLPVVSTLRADRRRSGVLQEDGSALLVCLLICF
jgi:hypothetical protein